jgi:hypothetical protein
MKKKLPIWPMVLIFRYLKREKIMTTNKNSGGFLSGVVHLINIILLVGLVYWAVTWIVRGPIGEKLIFLVVLFVFFLFYI